MKFEQVLIFYDNSSVINNYFLVKSKNDKDYLMCVTMNSLVKH